MTLIDELNNLRAAPACEEAWGTLQRAADMLVEAERLLKLSLKGKAQFSWCHSANGNDVLHWLAKLRGTPGRESE